MALTSYLARHRQGITHISGTPVECHTPLVRISDASKLIIDLVFGKTHGWLYFDPSENSLRQKRKPPGFSQARHSCTPVPTTDAICMLPLLPTNCLFRTPIATNQKNISLDVALVRISPEQFLPKILRSQSVTTAKMSLDVPSVFPGA